MPCVENLQIAHYVNCRNTNIPGYCCQGNVFCDCYGNMAHFLCSVERIKSFLNVHLHCIVSNVPSKGRKYSGPPELLRSEISFSRTWNILKQGFSNYVSQPQMGSWNIILGSRNKLAWQTRCKCFCKLIGRLHVSLTSRLSIKGPRRKNYFKMRPQNKKFEKPCSKAMETPPKTRSYLNEMCVLFVFW